MASSVKTSATRSGSCALPAAFHASSTPVRMSMTSRSRALAAVDVQDFAGDERRALQVDDCVDEVARVA